jgi:hypothetical protein
MLREATDADVDVVSGPPQEEVGTRRRFPIGPFARALPLLSVLGATVAVLVRLDTSVWDVVRYSGYLVWAVLLPGVLVYRALRRVPHSLVDDLAMGAALGLVLEIVAYVAFSVTGLRSVLWLWPAVVVVPFVVLRPLRQHWRPTGYRRAPLGWSWGVAGVSLFMLYYLTFAFFRPNAPVPIKGTGYYFIDQLFLLSLAGDAKHHFPLQTPQVVGEGLWYHWFAFAHMASASMISGVDLPVVFFRFFLATICPLAVLLLAVVGWRVSGRPWVGVIATALVFGIGEVVVGSRALSVLGSTTTYTVWSSESVAYGWVITFPMIALALDRILGGLPDSPIGRGAWPLLAVFAFAAPGGKASILPVVLSAAGLVALVELVRRRFTGATWKIIGLLLAAQAFGTMVIYGLQGQGVQIRPLAAFHQFVSTSRVAHGPWWKLVALYGVLLAGYAIYMFARLAGIPVLAGIRRREWGAVEWFLLGGAAGGAVATLTLWHTTSAQNYFVRSGFAFGAVLSAMGAVALVERHRVRPAVVVGVAVGAVALSSVVSRILYLHGGAVGGPGWAGMLPIFRPAAVLAIVALIVAAVLLVARLRWPSMRGLASTAVLVIALGAGAPALVWDAVLYPNALRYYHSSVSPEQAAAARWLRANSDPNEVAATNAHCVSPPQGDCWHLSFWLSAFSERRFLVESWGYTAKANAAAGERRDSPILAPFWDEQTIANNDASFYAPTPALLAWMWERGVRWLVADRQAGRESDALRTLADLRWETGVVAVYQLRKPVGSPT